LGCKFNQSKCSVHGNKCERIIHSTWDPLLLHVSTAKELPLFDSKTPLKDKKIIAEACIHYLWFIKEDYGREGKFIKWNPTIKSSSDRYGFQCNVG